MDTLNAYQVLIVSIKQQKNSKTYKISLTYLYSVLYLNTHFSYFIKDVSNSKLTELGSKFDTLRAEYEQVQTAKTELERNFEHQQVKMWCRLNLNLI